MQRFWTDVNNTPPPTRLGNSETGVFFTSYFGKYVQSYAACFLAIVTKIGKKRKILIKSGFFVLK